MSGCDIGRMQIRGLREGFYGGIVAHHEIEHSGKESRIGGGTAQRVGPDSALGQEGTQPLRILRHEREGLNRNDFSDFPGIAGGFFHAPYLPFRNLWFLVSGQSCPSLRKLFKQVETTLRTDRRTLTG